MSSIRVHRDDYAKCYKFTGLISDSDLADGGDPTGEIVDLIVSAVAAKVGAKKGTSRETFDNWGKPAASSGRIKE